MPTQASSIMWFHLGTIGAGKGGLAACPESRKTMSIVRVLPSLQQAVFQVTKDQFNASFPVSNLVFFQKEKPTVHGVTATHSKAKISRRCPLVFCQWM